ncbi:DUF551 domain-containing protein [Klebsiella pneumoniae]|nr:DUF551 domain-containing protein [Klebsiella pneumoniae]MCB8438267.1 DUF551 domain-containing protein [Klebsiella pneumoniae]MCB8467887.1 DUF551 domain-containing protein [Klebsiella pneumoniae]
MTKSTITRERLEWLSQISCRDDIEDIGGDEIRELASMALAAMDSEPVAWLAIYHGEVYDEAIGITRSVVEAQADHFGWESALTEIIPLYRHAQPVPVVPEEMTAGIAVKHWEGGRGSIESFVAGYNFCRASMLAAAPQSPGSEPATVPGKWIPVSERMPEVGDIVLTAMGGAVNVGEMECSAANCRFFTSVISGRELPATHWMPLPAGPKEDINALIPLVSRNEQEGK